MAERKKPQWLGTSLIDGPYLTLALDARAYKKAMKHLGIAKEARTAWVPPGSDATTHLASHPKHGLSCVVCLRRSPDVDDIQIYALLVHEAVHVFQLWCQNHGERSPSEEFQAYSIQTIAQRLMQSYAEQTTTNKE